MHLLVSQARQPDETQNPVKMYSKLILCQDHQWALHAQQHLWFILKCTQAMFKSAGYQARVNQHNTRQTEQTAWDPVCSHYNFYVSLGQKCITFAVYLYNLLRFCYVGRNGIFLCIIIFSNTPIFIAYLYKMLHDTSPGGEVLKILFVGHCLNLISRIQEKTLARNFCSFSSEALQ